MNAKRKRLASMGLLVVTTISGLYLTALMASAASPVDMGAVSSGWNPKTQRLETKDQNGKFTGKAYTGFTNAGGDRTYYKDGKPAPLPDLGGVASGWNPKTKRLETQDANGKFTGTGYTGFTNAGGDGTYYKDGLPYKAPGTEVKAPTAAAKAPAAATKTPTSIVKKPTTAAAKAPAKIATPAALPDMGAVSSGWNPKTNRLETKDANGKFTGKGYTGHTGAGGDGTYYKDGLPSAPSTTAVKAPTTAAVKAPSTAAAKAPTTAAAKAPSTTAAKAPTTASALPTTAAASDTAAKKPTADSGDDKLGGKRKVAGSGSQIDTPVPAGAGTGTVGGAQTEPVSAAADSTQTPTTDSSGSGNNKMVQVVFGLFALAIPVGVATALGLKGTPTSDATSGGKPANDMSNEKTKWNPSTQRLETIDSKGNFTGKQYTGDAYYKDGQQYTRTAAENQKAPLTDMSKMKSAINPKTGKLETLDDKGNLTGKPYTGDAFYKDGKQYTRTEAEKQNGLTDTTSKTTNGNLQDMGNVSSGWNPKSQRLETKDAGGNFTGQTYTGKTDHGGDGVYYKNGLPVLDSTAGAQGVNPPAAAPAQKNTAPMTVAPTPQTVAKPAPIAAVKPAPTVAAKPAPTAVVKPAPAVTPTKQAGFDGSLATFNDYKQQNQANGIEASKTGAYDPKTSSLDLTEPGGSPIPYKVSAPVKTPPTGSDAYFGGKDTPKLADSIGNVYDVKPDK